MKKILAVQEVRISLLKSNPPQLIVSASGLTSSPGWTDARLVPGAAQPSPGELHLDFVANPPRELAPWVLMVVSANILIPEGVEDLARVVVHASSNQQDVALSSELQTQAGGGGDTPTPFQTKRLAGGSGDSPTPFHEHEGPSDRMIGMTLRVVRPGDVVTGDYDENRINLFVNDTNRIEKILVG